MSMGEILRTAREQRAVTTSTAAEATHMKVQILEDLENEDFRGIAAPIYGRGFVKLYAEYLELDAAPLVVNSWIFIPENVRLPSDVVPSNLSRFLSPSRNPSLSPAQSAVWESRRHLP